MSFVSLPDAAEGAPKVLQRPRVFGCLQVKVLEAIPAEVNPTGGR